MYLRSDLLNLVKIGPLNLHADRRLDSGQLHFQTILDGHGPSIRQSREEIPDNRFDRSNSESAYDRSRRGFWFQACNSFQTDKLTHESVSAICRGLVVGFVGLDIAQRAVL